MIICPNCSKKYLKHEMYEKHKAIHTSISDASEPELDLEPATPEKVNLHFNRAIEVGINGVRYDGTDVVAPSVEIASEIIRIARGQYGPYIFG